MGVGPAGAARARTRHARIRESRSSLRAARDHRTSRLQRPGIRRRRQTRLCRRRPTRGPRPPGLRRIKLLQLQGRRRRVRLADGGKCRTDPGTDRKTGPTGPTVRRRPLWLPPKPRLHGSRRSLISMRGVSQVVFQHRAALTTNGLRASPTRTHGDLSLRRRGMPRRRMAQCQALLRRLRLRDGTLLPRGEEVGDGVAVVGVGGSESFGKS